MAVKPGEKKGKTSAPADIRKEVEAMKASFSMDVSLAKHLGIDKKDPGKRADAAQEVAGIIQKVAGASVPPVVAVFSIGSSGRIWSLSSPSGIIKVSYQNEEEQPIRIEFFRFDQNSPLVKEIRDSLQAYS